MKEIVDYTVLIAAGAAVIGTAAYAEANHGLNWWLVALPLIAVACPALSRFFKRA